MNVANNQTISLADESIREYNESTKHLFSKEEQAFFEKIRKNMPVFPKYWEVQKEHINRKIQKIITNEPQMPVIKVLIKVLDGLPEWLPPRNMIEVTTYVVEEWERLQKEQAKKLELSETV